MTASPRPPDLRSTRWPKYPQRPIVKHLCIIATILVLVSMGGCDSNEYPPMLDGTRLTKAQVEYARTHQEELLSEFRNRNTSVHILVLVGEQPNIALVWAKLDVWAFDQLGIEGVELVEAHPDWEVIGVGQKIAIHEWDQIYGYRYKISDKEISSLDMDKSKD